jgi:hypothetical protein
MSEPDKTMAWREILTTGLTAGWWKIASPDTLRRHGSRICDALPAALRGYWDQDTKGVRWTLTETRIGDSAT